MRENCLQHIVEQFLKILVDSFSKELQNVDEEENEDNGVDGSCKNWRNKVLGYFN